MFLAAATALLVILLSVLLLFLLIITVTFIVRLAHAQGNLLHALTSDSDASRTVAATFRSS